MCFVSMNEIYSVPLLKTSLRLKAQFSAITRAPLYRLVEWNTLRHKVINLYLTKFKSSLHNAKQNSLPKNITFYGARFVLNLKTSEGFQQVVSC